jgi:hypothetical protein
MGPNVTAATTRDVAEAHLAGPRALGTRGRGGTARALRRVSAKRSDGGRRLSAEAGRCTSWRRTRSKGPCCRETAYGARPGTSRSAVSSEATLVARATCCGCPTKQQSCACPGPIEKRSAQRHGGIADALGVVRAAADTSLRRLVSLWTDLTHTHPTHTHHHHYHDEKHRNARRTVTGPAASVPCHNAALRAEAKPHDRNHE